MKKSFLKKFLALILIFAQAAGPIAVAAEGADKPEISIDYRAVAAFKSEEDYATYLERLVSGLDGEMKAATKAEIATYIETAVCALASVSMEAASNQLLIGAKDIKDSMAAARSAKERLKGILESKGIAVNKAISICLNIEGLGFDLSSPGQVAFDSKVGNDMAAGESIRILLGDNRHSISITADSLSALSKEYGGIIVRFKQTGFKKFALSFLTEDDKQIDKINAAVSFTLPANSSLATVLATYSGGADNWGGQYDESNGAIEFSTRFSGTYEVMEENARISDISALLEEERLAVSFMVSKGYFSLNGDSFEPSKSLTKYDFIAALVKMFFALDRSAESSFSDVTRGSDYYFYVASAEAEKIARGDNTGRFHGDKSITVQEVLALSARTLAEKKSYSYPENPGEYLGFSDREKIGAWAKEDVALAVREGLILQKGALNPDGEMTRAESALILYRLFMLLYETSPIPFEIGAVSNLDADIGTDGLSGEKGGPSLSSVIDMLTKVLAGVAAIGLIACLYMLFFRKKTGKRHR